MTKLYLRVTIVLPAALSRQHPGVSVADCVLCQAPVGCAVLLSDFTVSLSTESTSLSSHPVDNFHLKKKKANQLSSYERQGF